MSFFNIFHSFFTAKAESEQPLFDSEEQIKYIALRLALSGTKLDHERKRIEDYYKKKEQSVELQYEDELDLLDEKLKQTKDDIQERNNHKIECYKNIDTLEKEQKSLNAKINEQSQINQGAWQKILQKRHEKGNEFFDDQTKKIAEFFEDDWNEIEKGIDYQIKIEEKLYGIQKKNYEINKEEFERRAEKCKEEQDKIEEELKWSTEQIEKLKTVGITRYSANFLLIVGFISLAGAGSIVANLLQDRQPGDDLVTWFVKSASNFVNSVLPADLTSWAPFLKPFIFVFFVCLFLGFFYFLIRISDRLIKRFDPTWDEATVASDNTSKQNRSGKKTQNKNFPDNLEEFVGGYQSIKSYFDFIPTSIERKDYTKLIASFPYIFLISAIIFLLAGRVNPNDTFTLATAYIGVIFVLLTASVAVLYVTRIIEPRWLRYANTQETLEDKSESTTNGQTTGANQNSSNGKTLDESKKSRFSSGYFWLNWELFFLVLSMLVSLVLAAVLPTQGITGAWVSQTPWITYLNQDGYKHLVWGSLAIFVSLSSLGLAYGIVQRGLFLNIDGLENKRNFFRALIERFNTQPVIGGERYYQAIYPDNLTTDYIDLRHQVENQKIFYEVNEIFADDYAIEPQPNDSDWYGIFNTLLYKSKKNLMRFFRRRHDLIRELRPLDFSSAGVASQEFVDSNAAIAGLEETRKSNDREINNLRQQINEAINKREELENRRDELAEKKGQVRNKKLHDLKNITDERERDLIIFTTAFTVGSVARPLLIEDGVPLPEPPEDKDFSENSSSNINLTDTFPQNIQPAVTAAETGNGVDVAHQHKIEIDETDFQDKDSEE